MLETRSNCLYPKKIRWPNLWDYGSKERHSKDEPYERGGNQGNNTGLMGKYLLSGTLRFKEVKVDKISLHGVWFWKNHNLCSI